MTSLTHQYQRRRLHAFCTCQEDRRRLQVDVKAKGAHLQQKDGQLHQQGVELQERATQISRQQRELQILTVRHSRKIMHA